jgi:hypothetical protein
LGKRKGPDDSGSSQKKRPALTGRAKKALPVDEGSLGGKKESRWRKEGSCEEKGRTYGGRAKKALRANESAVGSQKKSCSQEVTSSFKLAS